ncbi:MAG: hypothetical protein L0212_12475 [Acidobacteria bacterium]|nr:hypothetical protein [Acidobacteriota bacterium]
MIFAATLAAAQDLGQRPAQPAPPAAQQPNADPTYQQLRNVGLSGEVAAASNLVLKRDAATFTFSSGTFQFLAPVNGKVTGAVFTGEGSFFLTPPIESEKRSLSILTNEPSITEPFSQLVVRFTDGTYEEIKKAAGVSAGAGDSGGASALSDVRNALRKKLHLNLEGRLLFDVLSDQPGGLFVAFIKGKKFSDKLLYIIDPLYELSYKPEEVLLVTYSEGKYGDWCSFHLGQEYAQGTANHFAHSMLDIEHQTLDVTVEKGGRLTGTAATRFKPTVVALRVVPFALYRSLRVKSVTDAAGQPLHFIQEDKDEDPQFFVVLPQAQPAGQALEVRVNYSGTEALTNEGNGNYYLSGGARDSWYPSSEFEDYSTYDLRFSSPKGLKLVASGERVEELQEGNQVISRWRSTGPQTVAAFQLGRFKSKEKKLEGLDFALESFANTELPSNVRALQQEIELLEQQGVRVAATLGNITTTGMIDTALAQGELSIRLFTEYFGPLNMKRLALTQQTADNYGQAWPGLVWLPISYFYDTTIRHQLGYDDPKGYFKSVAPHEVAHQWWGHMVTWASYRDQWMSEGFSETSASLYIQLIQKNNKEFIRFWDDQKELMLEKNRFGNRAIDIGPVTMGYRASSSKAGGDIARRLIYPKGGYILHMIRMMLWNPQTQDERFKTMMKDFVKAYSSKPATTENFKAMVEKHMFPSIDLDGNGRMDWFFNPYVYGVALPHYNFEHTLTGSGDSQTLTFKVTQSNVDPEFKMVVPIYLEMADGKVFRLGTIPMIGNSTRDAKVPLAGLKGNPKRAMLNYFNDVLCTQEEKK